MSVTYTNRRGVTYHLCRGITKTGKPRYCFARQPRGEPVEEIPEGFRISESVNGIVSLVKDRTTRILPEEIAVVEAALGKHPKARNYRISVKHDRIEVYEQVGPDAEEVIAALTPLGLGTPELGDRIQARLDHCARFTPVLRFILAEVEQRTFRTEQMYYRSSVNGWASIHPMGPLDQLARRVIPKLRTDAFFDLC